METKGSALGEISRLEKQRDAAMAEDRRVVERLKEINSRRAAFVSGAAGSEKGAAEEIGALVSALDEEAATLSRTKFIAEDAARRLDRLILEAEVRLREKEKRSARGRYEALREERYALDGDAEKAMASLIEVLDRLESLHEEQVHAAAYNSHLAQDPRGTIEQWLARRLRRWLSLGSLERYDAPLSELDPLARKLGSSK